MSPVADLKFLLLQARDADDPMRDHERMCFVERGALKREQIVPYDLLGGPPGSAHWRQSDGLLVGGAGDFYISKRNLPHCADVLDFFGEVVAAGHPMFASCFGYHCLVAALGGEVVYDGANIEIGTYRLTLTEDGMNDPLFGMLPRSFQAQEGHKDRAGRQPDGVPNLASSAGVPMQALRIPEKPIWATQFHPELSRESNLHRFRHYMEGYGQAMSPEELQAAFDSFRESPEANGLFQAFLRLVFG